VLTDHLIALALFGLWVAIVANPRSWPALTR